MDDTGRWPSTNRSVAAMVFILAVVAFLLLAALAALVLLGPWSGWRASQLPTPAPSIAPLAGQSGQPSADLVGSAEAVGRGWSDIGLAPTPIPVLAKPVVSGGAVQVKWTATPVPTNTPTPSPTPNPTFVSSAYGLGSYMPEGITPNERWIDVDVTRQKLVAYQGFVPVFETLVSTGTARHPTVTGQFRIWLRFQSQDMNGYRLGYDYYLRDVPYVQYFYQDYALHGTFWHSNFGTPMSHGCVNLATPDAEWLYNWAGYGTLVNVHP